NPFYYFACHIGQPVVSSFEFVSQLRVLDAEQVQHRGVEVMNVNGVLRDVVGKIIRRTISHAAFDAAPGHPDGKAARVMIAPKAVFLDFALAVSRAPEL